MASQINKRQINKRDPQQNRLQGTSTNFIERLGDQLEGKGRTILYALGALVILGAALLVFNAYRERGQNEARQALGRAIEISQARVSTDPLPAPQTPTRTPTFASERERAEAAIKEFQQVAEKHGEPHRSFARYFIAVNTLTLDRNRGMRELEQLVGNSNEEVADAAKFALAQAREDGGQLDQAATLYTQLLKENNSIYAPETLRLRLANIYEKQGKRAEAANLLFEIAANARKAQGTDGKPAPVSASARAAAERLQTLDPARYAQLPPEPVTNPFG